MTEPTREQLDNLLDHAHKRRLGPAEVDRIRAGLDALRQQLALSQAGASQREMLLTEARDALEAHGGHGDAWPDIVAPIHALIAERDRLVKERDRWRRGYDHHYQRAERAEEADQRVRDYATGLKAGTIPHGLTAAGCADRILAALDNQERA
ncbi:hypothetical protein ACFRCG_39760 [Embleya sp. NPDC056575]|uniref:hypothetical protein n=1 Tax=unclassified Embleya TaxID=2699296 RepID=UPI0036A2B90D